VINMKKQISQKKNLLNSIKKFKKKIEQHKNIYPENVVYFKNFSFKGFKSSLYQS